MLMLYTPRQIPECSIGCTKYLDTAAFASGGTYMTCVHLCTWYDIEKFNPAQFSIQFQHCPCYWTTCSHATWFFAMGAAILLQPSWNLPYLETAILPAWATILQMHFTSSNKFKHLSDKMFLK